MYVRVHAVPGSKKESVTKTSETEVTICVREPAERNLANKRIRVIIAETYGVEIGKIRIVSGYHSPTKMFDVDITIEH